MKIGINGRFLLTKKTGVQRAAYNLVKALFEMDNENQYFFFTSKDQINNKEWDKPNVTVVGSDIKYGENFKNHLWEQMVLPVLRSNMMLIFYILSLILLLYSTRVTLLFTFMTCVL